MIRPCALDAETLWRAWISGRRISTSSATRAGDAGRRPTAKILFSPGRMGVAFVTGMQGDDPKYFRVIATPKHFAVHSGPEPSRHSVDVQVSKHDEEDTYLPAFRAAVTEGKAGVGDVRL